MPPGLAGLVVVLAAGADVGAWTAYLDSVEAQLEAGAHDPERLRAMSDALRRRRDAALAAGRGALTPALVRRSARLVARLEAARIALERAGGPGPSAGGEGSRRPGRGDAAPAIYLREHRTPLPDPAWPAPPATADTPFVFSWPLRDVRITSGFGTRPDPFTGARWDHHDGIDLAGEAGEPVLAVGPGRIRFAGWRDDGCGYTVILAHPGELETEYCHLSDIAVAAGQLVAGGDVLGHVGSSGRSTGHHLHWAVRYRGRALDPRDVVGRRSDVIELPGTP